MIKRAFLALIITLSLLPVNAEAAARRILAFGDSLMSGYGIALEKSFPSQLEQELKKQGYEIAVINGGVSGDTTSGGLTRLEWLLTQRPEAVIVELGGNDMLRGIDPAVTRQNLEKILKILRQRRIPTLLAGMKAFTNLGPGFQKSYQKIYAELADDYNAVYYPFFLEGVAFQPGLMQDDGIHPTAKGVGVIVKNIFPSVKKLLEVK